MKGSTARLGEAATAAISSSSATRGRLRVSVSVRDAMGASSSYSVVVAAYLTEEDCQWVFLWLTVAPLVMRTDSQ